MPSNLFVVLMGLGTVFFGLVCIILLCSIMSRVCALIAGRTAAPQTAAPAEVHTAPTVQAAPVQDRAALIAAISAAIAEELGADVSAIRICSLKLVGGAAAVSGGNRQELIAAISAAIAEDLGTDISGIRVRSFRQIA